MLSFMTLKKNLSEGHMLKWDRIKSGVKFSDKSSPLMISGMESYTVIELDAEEMYELLGFYELHKLKVAQVVNT